MRFSLQNIKNLANLVKELSVGLKRLSFNDNFESFTTTVVIPATSVAEIRNRLTFIPSSRIIVKQDVEAAISDSSTPWTVDYVYLENHGTNEVTLKVIFIR